MSFRNRFSFSFSKYAGAAAGGVGPSGDALLLESGDFFLLETSDFLLLE